VLDVLPKQKSILLLNYHRIGDWERTLYDEGVFSPTREEFAEQLKPRARLNAMPAICSGAACGLESGGGRGDSAIDGRTGGQAGYREAYGRELWLVDERGTVVQRAASRNVEIGNWIFTLAFSA